MVEKDRFVRQRPSQTAQKAIGDLAPPPETVHTSRNSAIQAVVEHADNHGYHVIILSTGQDSRKRTFLRCTTGMGPEERFHACTFSVLVSGQDDEWKVEVLEASHDHSKSRYQEAKNKLEEMRARRESKKIASKSTQAAGQKSSSQSLTTLSAGQGHHSASAASNTSLSQLSICTSDLSISQHRPSNNMSFLFARTNQLSTHVHTLPVGQYQSLIAASAPFTGTVPFALNDLTLFAEQPIGWFCLHFSGLAVLTDAKEEFTADLDSTTFRGPHLLIHNGPASISGPAPLRFQNDPYGLPGSWLAISSTAPDAIFDETTAWHLCFSGPATLVKQDDVSSAAPFNPFSTYRLTGEHRLSYHGSALTTGRGRTPMVHATGPGRWMHIYG